MALVLPVAAAADPVIDIDHTPFDFGLQPFGSENVGTVTLTNVSADTVQVAIERVFTPDDFADLISSTCDLSAPTSLAPGESCGLDVKFRPSEFFAGFEQAVFRMIATDPSDNELQRRRIRFIGVGVDATGWDRTVDFTAHGEGPLEPTFFDSAGVRFTEGDFVGYIQGDQALVGPVRFWVYGPPDRAVLTFAPSVQGTAEYTLTAYGARGRVLASTELVVTQDTGTSSSPFGYRTIELSDLPPGTRSLALTNTFVGSSFPHIEQIGFGVSTIALFD